MAHEETSSSSGGATQVVNQEPPEQDLPSLDGRILIGVCFVRDHVELHFDDASVFRALGAVRVDSGAGVLEHPAPAARIALWRLIGQPVRATADERTRLVVEVGGTRVVVSKAATYPEVAQLVPAVDGRLDVVNMMEWLSVPGDDGG